MKTPAIFNFMNSIKLMVFFLLFSLSVNASNYYWVGGTGHWNDFSVHWATSSGGTVFHTAPPSIADDVFIDSNSVVKFDTIFFDDAISYCRDLNVDANTDSIYFETPSANPYSFLQLGGNLNVVHRTFWDHEWMGGVGLYLNPTNFQTTLFAPESRFQQIQILDSCKVLMMSELSVYGGILFDSSGISFLTNNYDLSCIQLSSWDPNLTPEIKLGTSNVEIGYSIEVPVDADSAHLIFNSFGTYLVPLNADKITIDSTAQINGYTWTPIKARELIIHGYFESNAVDTIGKLTLFFSGDFNAPLVCDTIILTNPYQYFAFSTVVVNNYIATISTPGNQIYFNGSAPGTLLVNNMDTVCLDYLKMSGVNALGSAVYYAGIFSDDDGGNTGWSFTSCSPLVSLVWPGDVNNDLIVDNLDLLLIGAGYFYTGDIRDSMSTLYMGHASLDWASTYANLVNMKYGDCNGDGVIFTDDTLAISENYGLTHPAFKGNTTPFPFSGIGAPLYFDYPGSTLTPGASYSLPISYGQTGGAGDMLYGLAFSIIYDTTQIDPSSVLVTFPPSWLADTADLLRMQRNDSILGSVSSALSRIDQNNSTGSGEIASLHFTVKPGSTGSIHFDFIRTLGLLANQSQILLQPISKTFNATTGFADNQPMSLSLWPNPANETITIRSAGLLQESKLRIFDTVGKLVSPETLLPPSASGTTIDISALVPGVYMVELQTTTQIKTQRLIVY